MVDRVVSTKLTEEEHTSLIERCNVQGQTPSSFIKAAILERLKSPAQYEEELETPTKSNADILSAKQISKQEIIEPKRETALEALIRLAKKPRPSERTTNHDLELMKLMRRHHMAEDNLE